MTLDVLSSWPRRRWVVAAMGAVVTAALVGVPTRLVPTPLFSRMIPVTWWAWPVWAVTALLGGLLIATYVRAPAAATSGDRGTRTAGIGGLLSVFAVGCPVCNKLVLLSLGASGAMNVFAPLQPVLGVVSVGLLAWGLRVRLRGELSCPVPAGGA